MRSQWRVGFNGSTGLDYAVLLNFMDRMGLSDEEHEQMLDDIAEMEEAALAAMREND
jgi:Phage related hypothetical protein (DUF1799).